MNESGMLTQERCHEIFERVLGVAHSCGVHDVEVMLGATSEALTRFAGNAIHQNVSELGRYISVRALIGQRTARATTNRLDGASIESVVREAIAVTKAAEPDPELPPLAEPWPIAPVDRHFESTARCTPAGRAERVAEAISAVRKVSQTAAGICSTAEAVEALLNSNGTFAYHLETMAKFSITAMAADSSGWAKATSPDLDRIDPGALAARAAAKAAWSSAPRELAPGRYVVILEPAAVLDLLGELFGDFSATAIEDQRSFLTGRMGKKLFGDNITIYDDVRHPLQDGAPFDGEGVARQRLTLVDRGTPLELAYSRRTAKRSGVEPTGHGFALPNEAGEAPENIVIAGGGTSIEEMIASTDRGVLVTRLWYIREVDPYEKIMTGMTRDGTFLIEGGRAVCGVKNFRFNQGLVEMLGNVEALSPAVRAAGEDAFGMVVPAMKVRGFHFTEVTRF